MCLRTDEGIKSNVFSSTELIIAFIEDESEGITSLSVIVSLKNFKDEKAGIQSVFVPKLKSLRFKPFYKSNQT